MTLDDIPVGARILIDANILIYARRGLSAQCCRLLARCAEGEVNGVLTTIALAEFCHRRMMQEAQSRGWSASNPAKALAQNPPIVRQLTAYKLEMEDLLAGDMAVEICDGNDFLTALGLQQTHGLLTNDSLQLAIGLRQDIKLLATADPQFADIPGFTLFRPDDVR